MPIARSKLMRYSGPSLLILTLFSMGTTITHQFNSNVSTQTMVLNHSNETHLNSIGVIGTHSPVTNVCIGVVFLILIFGRKFVLKNRIWPLSEASQLTHWRAFRFTRPPNLKFALTLPQLGILRI